MKIYAISNPAFLSDTFIFKNIKDVWNCGPVDEWFYIKLNRRNKIEEIGVNIENRLMQPLKNDLLKEANKTQKRIFNSIGTEFWATLLVRSKK